jgi:hypothetical protein
MKKGNWEKPPEEAQPQVPTDEIWEQMDKDFEDYKKLMAAGMYPEAEKVEQSVREMKQRNPNMPSLMILEPWRPRPAIICDFKKIGLPIKGDRST